MSASQPALFEHCLTVFNEMLQSAKKIEIDGHEVVVYEGMFTRLFQNVGLSVPYYSSVRKMLIAMDCIRQLRRGGGSAPSQWMLLKEPNLVDFMTAQSNPSIDTPASSRAQEQTQQMVRDLATRVSRLEEVLGIA